MLGIWKGKYKYKLKKDVKFNNKEAEFLLEIKEFDGENFSGTIEDKDEYFGTKGIGTVEGTISGKTIDFFKKMPIKTVVLNHNKRIEVAKKKHKPIYYSGVSDQKDTFSGIWKMKGGLSFYNMQLYLSFPTIGSWEMSKM